MSRDFEAGLSELLNRLMDAGEKLKAANETIEWHVGLIEAQNSLLRDTGRKLRRLKDTIEPFRIPASYYVDSRHTDDDYVSVVVTVGDLRRFHSLFDDSPEANKERG